MGKEPLVVVGNGAPSLLAYCKKKLVDDCTIS